MVEATYWDPRLYQSYRTFGGLYSSYPTKKQFTHNISPFSRFSALHSSVKQRRELAVYVNFPDLANSAKNNTDIFAQYLSALLEEIRILAAHAKNTPIRHLHFTGNATQFSAAQLGLVIQRLKQYFVIECHNLFNYSINTNPYETNWAAMGAFRDMGFNRINLQAHTAEFNFEQLQTIYEAARTLHYGSISIAMAYGQPKQNKLEFSRELEQVISLMPERITLRKSQHAACIKVLPKLLELAIKKLKQAGYHYVGLDCFVLPDDELIAAQEAGLVSCSLQGFATHDDADILGFGTQAISQMGKLYYQNTALTQDYIRSLKNKQLPPALGITCSQDDLIRRNIIHSLTNLNSLSIKKIENTFKIKFFEYFHEVTPHLNKMHQDGLIKLEAEHIKMSLGGHFLVDAVCQLFDRSQPTKQPTHELYIQAE